MNRIRTFYKEKKRCKPPFDHLEENITDPALKKIDELYGVANALSIEYSMKYKDNLEAIAILIPLIAFFFLLYDEAELHWLIIVCFMLIVMMLSIYFPSKEKKYHEKYLEYRVIAEALRVQYYLSISNVKTHVSEILPWFIKMGIPGIEDFLKKLPKIKTDEKRFIIDCWIRDQMTYHDNAFKTSSKQKKRNDLIEKISLIMTIVFFAVTLGIEFYMLFYSPWDEVFSNQVRAALKILIGSMSVLTIFLGNYYGKMSLPSKIDEHRRMYALYEKAEREIMDTREESEELIVNLAREFLIENATWYAHQKKNHVDFSVEA